MRRHYREASMTDCRFSCTLGASTESPLPHVWEHTVGSCHATLALRADWQRQLLRCRRELSFRHARLHGILCDDMSTLVREKGALMYSFFNVDQICDWVERYGPSEVRRWFFEIWNEPNLAAFWTGSQADYFRLYRHAARTIKDVDGALAVGGPPQGTALLTVHSS
jgi:xylan 1,4-beta-xylosidase